MVNNFMDAVKGTGSSNSSQTQKNKKPSAKDKPDFGQALSDAAGAANSANAQPENTTYDQKDASLAENSTEGVQAVQSNPGR